MALGEIHRRTESFGGMVETRSDDVRHFRQLETLKAKEDSLDLLEMLNATDSSEAS